MSSLASEINSDSLRDKAAIVPFVFILFYFYFCSFYFIITILKKTFVSFIYILFLFQKKIILFLFLYILFKKKLVSKKNLKKKSFFF